MYPQIGSSNDTPDICMKVRQAAVTIYLKSKHLLLFVITGSSVCQYSMAEENPAAQKQTAVTANFSSKQLLLTAYFPSKQLLLFVFAMQISVVDVQS